MKTKTAIKHWQQGDLIGRRLSCLPEGAATLISRKHLVLAEGEHTGHAHVIEDEEAELIRIGEQIILRLSRTATVVHPEHKPITLAPGIWEIGRVREYDYFAHMERQVTD